jgi:hypothetical protein
MASKKPQGPMINGAGIGVYPNLRAYGLDKVNNWTKGVQAKADELWTIMQRLHEAGAHASELTRKLEEARDARPHRRARFLRGKGEPPTDDIQDLESEREKAEEEVEALTIAAREVESELQGFVQGGAPEAVLDELRNRGRAQADIQAEAQFNFEQAQKQMDVEGALYYWASVGGRAVDSFRPQPPTGLNPSWYAEGAEILEPSPVKRGVITSHDAAGAGSRSG